MTDLHAESVLAWSGTTNQPRFRHACAHYVGPAPGVLAIVEAGRILLIPPAQVDGSAEAS